MSAADTHTQCCLLRHSVPISYCSNNRLVPPFPKTLSSPAKPEALSTFSSIIATRPTPWLTIPYLLILGSSLRRTPLLFRRPPSPTPSSVSAPAPPPCSSASSARFCHTGLAAWVCVAVALHANAGALAAALSGGGWGGLH